MDDTKAALAFLALGHETRVAILRRIVQSGRTGMNISEIVEKLDVPHSTLAFHLAQLVKAGLVRQTKNGREVCNHADLESVENLSFFFTKVCCLDDPSKGEAVEATDQNGGDCSCL